jgi:hypothetical protein
MNPRQGPLALIKRHRKAFIRLNAAFYGLFALAIAVTTLAPEIQPYFKEGIDQAYMRPGIFKTVADAYGSRNLLMAIGLTFAINLTVAFSMTTLPSLIIPFIGILAVMHRALLWGIMFAPIGTYRPMWLPHALTLAIEGQAYVLAAFAAWVQGRIFLRLDQGRMSTRFEAWKAGLTATLKLYPLILLTLIVGAVYEVFEAIYIIPRLL